MANDERDPWLNDVKDTNGLVVGLRGDILTGRLAGGTRVTPTAKLADQLGLRHNVVARAYAELAAENLLAPRQQAGTFVSQAMDRLPEDVIAAADKLADLAISHNIARTDIEAAVRSALNARSLTLPTVEEEELDARLDMEYDDRDDE